VRSEVELARFQQALSDAETTSANAYATLRSIIGIKQDMPAV